MDGRKRAQVETGGSYVGGSSAACPQPVAWRAAEDAASAPALQLYRENSIQFLFRPSVQSIVIPQNKKKHPSKQQRPPLAALSPPSPHARVPYLPYPIPPLSTHTPPSCRAQTGSNSHSCASSDKDCMFPTAQPIPLCMEMLMLGDRLARR
jgi:hypothetical protein